MSLMDRRKFMAAGTLAGLVSVAPRASGQDVPIEHLPFDNSARPLVRLPGKRALLQVTARPPQLETPIKALGEAVLTPNDAFFVRYHLAGLPLDLDLGTYRLKVGGKVSSPLDLTLRALQREFRQHEVVAVNQCSGNGRGFFEPRIGGGQLGNGAVGNARWRGVRLKDVLDRAGVLPGAVQVSFAGLDTPPSPTIPDYVKALDIAHARSDEVLLAWDMNGAPLPFLNGYPLRLVVPGYYGTYWIKHLSEITVLDQPYDGYWMKTAYRIPDNDCACVPAGTRPEATRAIGRLNVRSLVTSHISGERISAGRAVLAGVAFDGGSGIEKVLVSIDEGAWQETALGVDLGSHSFQRWHLITNLGPGVHRIRARALARSGEAQPFEAKWNPAGYMRNVVETVTVEAA